eukprot:symbB.v1.2.030540.t1/scaffold3452.1/size56362/4
MCGMSRMEQTRAVSVAVDLRCGPQPVGLTFNAAGAILQVEPGTWAEEQGLRVGDQLLAIGGASVKEHLKRRSNGSMEPGTLMGPQRIMIQLQAAQEDVKQALRSVSAEREKEQCLRFREALKNEAQRFDFREALQGELSCWRPRDTWPFPALPSAAVDAVAELRHVTGSGVPPGPSIKALEAAARKLQSMFRWRKLWVQLDTSKERQAAAKKIQALQRGRQVRKGLAAQFAETASNGSLEAVEVEVDPVLPEPVVEEVLPEMPSTQVKLEVDTELTRSLSFEASQVGQWPASSLELPVQKLPSVQSKTSEDEDKVQLYGPGTEVSQAQTAPSQAAMLGFFDSPEVEAAAIRIQAVERGRQQRKQLKMMEKTTEVMDVMDVVDVEVPSALEDSSVLRRQLVIKIQKGQRRRPSRRRP